MPKESHDRARLVKTIADVLTEYALGRDFADHTRASAIAARISYLIGPRGLTWDEVFAVLMNPLHAAVMTRASIDDVARNLATIAHLHLENGRGAAA